MTDVDTGRAGRQVERLVAGLVRGPVEVLDFLLPLWAGQVLGLSPAAVGQLVAAETLVSFLARPVAGALADRVDRGRLAAAGALLYAVSFTGYAAAGGFGSAAAAAVVGGVGGAVFWIALRARVGEDVRRDPGTFSKLFAAEGTGTWVAFVVAITVVGSITFRGVFGLAAAACVVGAGLLLLAAPAAPIEPALRQPAFTRLGRRMWPMLAIVVVVAIAETGVGLLLLLHLQRGFGLELGAIAAVFLPGFVVYSTLPEFLHGLVTRLGRTRVVTLSLVASAVFAAALSFAPSPWVIAVAWILAAAAFAAVIPVEQSVVAEAAGVDLGRGMAIYESATLLGATVGAVAAGLLYGSGSGWQTACVAAATILLVAAVLIRPALRAVGVQDRAEPAPTAGPGTGPVDGKALPPKEGSATQGRSTATEPDRHPECERDRRSGPSWRNWAIHAGGYVLAQVPLALFGYSWPVEAVVGGPHDATWFWNSSGDRLLDVGRIWTYVFVLDSAWTLGRALLAPVRRDEGPGSTGA